MNNVQNSSGIGNKVVGGAVLGGSMGAIWGGLTYKGSKYYVNTFKTEDKFIKEIAGKAPSDKLVKNCKTSWGKFQKIVKAGPWKTVAKHATWAAGIFGGIMLVKEMLFNKD